MPPVSDCVPMIPLIEDYRVIVTRTFSKIWGLAGARLGYAIASEEISSLLRANVITFNVNKMVIAAAKASLDDKEFLESTWKENKEGKEFLTEKMKRLRLEGMAFGNQLHLCNGNRAGARIHCCRDGKAGSHYPGKYGIYPPYHRQHGAEPHHGSCL